MTLISAGLDEVPMVYKDIHEVMGAQTDLAEVVGEFLSAPPPADALEAARNRREGRLRMRRLSRMGQAHALAMAELRGRDPRALDAGLPALRAVAPDDVARVAARWLTLDTPTVAIAR